MKKLVFKLLRKPFQKMHSLVLETSFYYLLGYTCECQHGYRGENCEIGSCASSPCQHGGTCTNIHDAYACACVAGYTGANCEVDIDDCENITCVHGIYIFGL